MFNPPLPINAPALEKFIPPTPGTVLPRRRLFDLLDRRAAGAKAVWVSGPAGAGKSTLLASYLAERKMPCIWYRVDARDADPESFFHCLGQAVDRVADFPRPRLPLWTPGHPPVEAASAARIFERLWQRFQGPVWIVFDNLQEASADPLLMQVMRRAVEGAAAGVRIWILSRSEPAPQMARALANRRMTTIGWPDLSFTLAEYEAVAGMLAPGGPPLRLARQLHRQTGGWIGALVHGLQHTPPDGAIAESPQMLSRIFAYFAREILYTLTPQWRGFLLQSALLEEMSAESAARMTGMQGAGNMLENFAQRNFFIERDEGPVTMYRYHPLFRDFLRLYLARTVAPPALRNLYRRAAATMFESGSMHEAVRLYSLAGDWDGLAQAILTCAPLMTARGEHRTVRDWLRLLPRSTVDQNPMLIFYEGLSRLPTAPPEARCHFARAYSKFGQGNDLEGCLLSWSGIVETFYIARDGTLELADWIREGERLSGRLPYDHDSALAARFAQGMLMALTLAAPGGAQTGVWLERCSRFLLQCPDRDLQLRLANTMAIATCVRGELHDAAIIVEHVRTRPPSADSPVADRIVFHLAKCLFFVLTGRNEKCAPGVKEALALCSQWGVHVFDCLLYALSAHAALASENMHSARADLEKIAARLPRTATFDLAHYYGLCAWEAYALGNLRRAQTLSKKGRRFAIASGWLPAILASSVLHARLLAESRRWKASEALIATALQQSRALGLVLAEFHGWLALAELRLLQGAIDEMREPLRRAFAISRARGVMAAPWTLRIRLSELCQRALQFGIEEDQVRRFIRRHHLLPTPPVVAGPEWPFEVRVRILGQRNVLCLRKPIAAADRAPPKLLELLDLLICKGPGGIGRQAAAERLWPEADGDCAQQNMSTALHRLKKLLCHERAVATRNGRLALSPQYCWVDAWHFESLLERAEAAPNRAAKERMLKAAVSLYDRPIAEASAASVLWFPYAARLEKKYQRALSDLQRLMAPRRIDCQEAGAACTCMPVGEEDLCRFRYPSEKNGHFG